MKKLLVFGVGKFFRDNKYELYNTHECEVVGFLDNNPQMWGGVIDDKPIYSPDNVRDLNFDIIVVMTGVLVADEIIEQLLKLSVQESRICRYKNLKMLNDNYIKSKRNTEQLEKVKRLIEGSEICNKIVALYTSEICIAGGVIVFLYLVKVLKEMGFEPIIIAIHDGNLCEKIQQEGIIVLIRGFAGEWEQKVVEKSEFIVINTFQAFHTITTLPKSKRVFWWLHEPSDYYANTKINFNQSEYPNVKVIAVSEVAKNNFLQYYKATDVAIMHYGIPDTAKPSIAHEKLTFAVIGIISKNKGQDILLQALKAFLPDEMNKCKFYFVGAKNDLKICNHIQHMQDCDIEFTGEISPQKVDELRRKIDITVCCSREETLSATIVEALMYGKVTIVSDKAGVCAFLKHGEDSLIFESENSKQLFERISWCIANQSELIKLGSTARKTYEKHFTMEVFKKNIRKTFNLRG